MLKKICDFDTDKKKPIFYCEKCNYEGKTKFLFNQHCKTKKHQKTECSKMLKKYARPYICNCGHKYTHIQSFNRHKKNCIKQNVIIQNTDDNKDLKILISTLVNQNQNILLENKEMREMVKDMIPKIGNNNNNTTINKFNLNLFLNEECKDAINLTDFVETLKLEFEDLDNTREKGYITGITNIFVRGLRQLDFNKRPIHCSDLKREVLYVKDNNIWEKDSNEKDKLKKALAVVSKRQINKIKEWEKNYPNWDQTEQGTANYIDMIKSLTQYTDSDNENKIIKTIVKEVIIDK